MAQDRDINHAPTFVILALIFGIGAAGFFINRNSSTNNTGNPALNNAYVRYVSGGTTVGPQRQILDASPANASDPIKSVSVNGSTVTVQFDHASAQPGDYIGIYIGTTPANTASYEFKYLNNTQNIPGSPVTSGSVTLTVPSATVAAGSPAAQPTLFFPTDRDQSQKQGTFQFELPSPPAEIASKCVASNLVYDDEGASNKNSNIFIALDPPNGQPIGAHRQIRAWVSDEAGGRFPGSATADANGNVTTHSDPLVDKDPHGYPWESALYLTQITAANENGPYSGDKENGGKPVFQHAVKGKVREKSKPFLSVPVHDDPNPFRIGTRTGDGKHVAEYIWNVDSLGLGAGNYRAQVSVHDGDSHLAIECTTLTL